MAARITACEAMKGFSQSRVSKRHRIVQPVAWLNDSMRAPICTRQIRFGSCEMMQMRLGSARKAN